VHLFTTVTSKKKPVLISSQNICWQQKQDQLFVYRIMTWDIFHFHEKFGIRKWKINDKFLLYSPSVFPEHSVFICGWVGSVLCLFHDGLYILVHIGCFYTRDALPIWMSFGKHFVTLPVVRLHTGDGRLDELQDVCRGLKNSCSWYWTGTACSLQWRLEYHLNYFINW